MSVAMVERAAPAIEPLLAWDRDQLPRVAAILALRRFWSGPLFRQLRAEYDRAIAGRSVPADVAEAAPIVAGLPSAGYFKWLHRHIQDLTWREVDAGLAPRLAAIEAAMAPRADDLGTLELDPATRYPAYYQFDFHRQAGGIWRDARGAAAYLMGARIVHVGRNNANELHDRFAADLGPLRPRRVLDLGCGFGKTTWSLKARFPDAEVHGIDLAAPCLALGRRIATERGLAIHWRQADIAARPDADDSADLATITMVLHEIPAEAIAACLAEARRVLRPGGMLAILENRWVDDPFKATLMADYSRLIDEPYSAPFRDLDLVAMLRDAGFDRAESAPWQAPGMDPAAERDPQRWYTAWALTRAWRA